jgi:hypothetical protein
MTILPSARARLPAAFGLALGLLASGCVWTRAVGVHAYQCFEGPLPPLDAPSLEKTGILRRELARESSLPPVARGYWAEGAAVFTSVRTEDGGFIDMCAVELGERFRDRLSASPLPYGREQVGLLRGMANLRPFDDIARNSRYFERIASLADASIAAYRPAKGETPQSGEQLRTLATLCVAGALPSPGYAPSPPFDQRLLAPARGLDALAFSPLARTMLDTERPPQARFMFARRSAYLAASLADPGLVEGDPALTAELTLALTAELAHPYLARSEQGQAELERIRDAEGRFPSTRDDPARALDLTVMAMAALSDRRSFGRDRERRHDLDLPEPDHLLVDLIPRRSTPHASWNDGRDDGWSRQRTLALVGSEIRRTWIAAVLAEMDAATDPQVRCLLAGEAVRWTTPDEADEVRSRLLVPVLANGGLTLGDELTCRFQAALHVDLDAARRPLDLVHRAIRTDPSGAQRDAIHAYAWSHDGVCDGARLHPPRPSPNTLLRSFSLLGQASRASVDAMLQAELADRPALAEDPLVRDFLERHEKTPNGDLRHGAEDPFQLTRTLLLFHASSRPGASLAWGRERLLDLIRQIERETTDPNHCPYLVPFARALFLLAEHAPGFGVKTEVEGMLQRLRGGEPVCGHERAREIAEIALRMLEAV